MVKNFETYCIQNCFKFQNVSFFSLGIFIQKIQKIFKCQNNKISRYD